MPRPLPVALLLLVSTAALHGQGALTPPGAPAPTMKSLQQISEQIVAIPVEPRRPVDANYTPGDDQNHFIITQPGSYYLTGDIVVPAGRHGITILAAPANRGVTLDLNGFSVVGPGTEATDTRNGIWSPGGNRAIAVRNGRVLDWSGTGILIAGPGHVLDVVVARTNGAGISIDAGFSGGTGFVGSLVSRCEVLGARETGILSFGGTVRDCRVDGVTATPGSATGISGQIVTGCSVDNVTSSVSNSTGISGRLVTDCVVANVSGIAVVRGISGERVSGCQINRTVLGVSGNLSNYGIDARQVERCNILAYAANTTGEVAAVRGGSVSHCVIERVSNATTGQVAAIQESSVASTGSGTSTTLALHAVGNTISGVNGVGIRAPFGVAHIEGNFIRGCTGIGIRTDTSGAILGNTVTIPSGSSSAGINAASCRVADNTVTNFGSGTGIVQTLGIAVRNTVQSGTAFSFAAGVRAGPIVTGGGSTAFDANANVDL